MLKDNESIKSVVHKRCLHTSRFQAKHSNSKKNAYPIIPQTGTGIPIKIE